MTSDWATTAAVKILADYKERGGDCSRILSEGGIAHIIREAHRQGCHIAAAVELLRDAEPLVSAHLRGKATAEVAEISLLYSIGGFNMAHKPLA